MSAPENPPAFPRDLVVRQEGMSLRDWFAGQALAQVVRDVFEDPIMLRKTPSELPSIIAAASYQIADAMLAEREERDDR